MADLFISAALLFWSDRVNVLLFNVDDIMELLEFICSTTYFTFDGTIMQQKFETAMGSPVSAVIANFYMEKLEHKALQTAPAECRPIIWKRYVDDVLDVIKKDQVKNFTDHLNSIDDKTVSNSLMKRKPTVLFPSWTCLSTASQTRLSKYKYTASPHIRINIYTSSLTIRYITSLVL